LAACRWPDGFVCPQCENRSARELTGLRRWQCAACRRQVSLTAGTVLHNTKLPLTIWFWAAYLMTTDKRGISALLLQRQLGLGCYETAWMMLHKFRRAMVNLEREPLRGEVEVDDTWIGGTQAGLRGSRQLKGRKAALVIVAVEKRGKASGRVRMAVIPDFKSVTLNAFVQQNVGSRFHDLHRRSQELRRFRTNRLQTYSAHPATARRPSQRCEIGGAIRGSGHWQSTTMAHWNLSWREPRSTAGLSG
jgi:transposase-like protein